MLFQPTNEAAEEQLIRRAISELPDGPFVFVRMDDALADVPAEDIALAQAAQTILLWSDLAFMDKGPLAQAGDTVILRPDIAGIIRAAYDPVMPSMADDESHAYRLAARLGEDRGVS